MHGFLEIDSVEDFHLIALTEQELTALNDDTALWVSYYIGAVALHEVWFEPKSCFPTARTAHNQHIFISCRFWVFGAVVHGQPFRLGEDYIVLECGVYIRLNVFCVAP